MNQLLRSGLVERLDDETEFLISILLTRFFAEVRPEFLQTSPQRTALMTILIAARIRFSERLFGGR